MNGIPLPIVGKTRDVGLNTSLENSKTSVDRSALNYQNIEEKYGHRLGKSFSAQVRCQLYSKFSCSTACFVSFLKSVFPVISWLPTYHRSFLLPDIVSGLTVAVLNIPQGMAYGVLATVKAENGLYLSIFPVLIYFILGTSKHVSIGTFSIISLMISSAVGNAQISTVPGYDFTISNATEGTLGEIPPSNLEIVVSLALTVGLIQLIMGVVHLGTFSVVLSDQLVSGFCTGAACHVATALAPEIFGISVTRHSGPLKVVYMWQEIIYKISNSNVATVVTTAIAIFVLACVKEQINDRFKTKMKMPVPIDLIVVIIGTTISYFLNLKEEFDIRVVGHIPTGLPSPLPPRIDLITRVLNDAFAIAIVVYVTTLSMAKLFAKKHHYSINANQELVALGCANIFSSFFSCFPCSAALARSSVQERSGGKTQIASLVSTFIMLLVTLVLAPMFYSLPRCILSAVILVALKGLFLQSREFFVVWNISKTDAMIWLITMLATVLLDVTYGLMVGVIFSVLTVILRTLFPSSTSLGAVDDTQLYLDTQRFSEAKEIKGIKIFHFESALYFVNREVFKNALFEHVPIIDEPSGEQIMQVASDDDNIHHIIIDCSSVSYIDVSGLDTLQEIVKEYNEVGITVFLAGCSVSLWDIMKKKNIFGNVTQQPVFPTIQEAVQFCNEL